jgi:hypothetical protein
MREVENEAKARHQRKVPKLSLSSSVCVSAGERGKIWDGSIAVYVGERELVFSVFTLQYNAN